MPLTRACSASGRDFGAVGKVLLDGWPVATSTYRDTHITLSVPKSSGNITVVVGTERSNTVSYFDFNPQHITNDPK